MSEGDLEELEDDAVDPAHFDVADDHHLEPPAEEVREEVNVHCCLVNVEERALGVLWRVEAAVLRIAFLRKWLAESGVEEAEEAARFL